MIAFAAWTAVLGAMLWYVATRLERGPRSVAAHAGTLAFSIACWLTMFVIAGVGR